LIMKQLNRNADDGNVVFFDLREDHLTRYYGRVVRKLGKAGEEGDDGWVDCVCRLLLFFSLLLTSTPGSKYSSTPGKLADERSPCVS
jgi:hypothetical protein